MPVAGERSHMPLSILIVEDEALVAMEIEAIITGAGHRVAGMADHLAGALSCPAAGIDLALVDVYLADGESGVDAAAALKRLGIPVMFVTGTCPGDAGQPVAVACLHKPFSDRTLLDGIDATMAAIAGRQPVELPPTLHLYPAVERVGLSPNGKGRGRPVERAEGRSCSWPRLQPVQHSRVTTTRPSP